jgi:RNA polymerase primary sigma factor
LLERVELRTDIELPALSGYTLESRRYPQLDSESQTEMVAAYQAAVELKARLEAGSIPARQRRAARESIQRGEDCLTYLVVSNFRLVNLIAREQATKRYPSRDRLAEMLPDLINEGNLALTEAVQKYDYTRGPYFTAYAARAIRDRVRYVLSRSVPVRMSASWSRIQRIARRTIPELHDQLGRAPSTPELQAVLLEKCMQWAETKLTPEQSRLPKRQRQEAMMAKLRKQGMLGAIDAVEEILVLGQGVASLDAEVGSEGDATLGDLVADQTGDRLFDDVELGELREALQAALATLTDRERMIVLYRYGFVDGESWTYDRISELYDVSSERIRQIEKAVLDKLRSPTAQFAGLSAFLPSQFEG